MSTFKYKAFVSYSWKDKVEAGRLHHALETYRAPRGVGAASRRLHPIFKDREEEAAGSSLRATIERALDQSEFLIVVCSPNSAKSLWVNKEIARFRKTRSPGAVLPYIIAGEPGASASPGGGANECFPPALMFDSSEDGAITETPIEAPLAADAREQGDGRRLARLKVAAALLGVGLDDLVRRDARRRAQRRQLAFATISTVAAALGGLSLFAFDQRDEARRQRAFAENQKLLAEKERDTASDALDYLVSIFQLANPATENPKTITALTILERGARKIDADLAAQPEVQAKLYGALGGVYQNLGDVDEAERLLKRAASLHGRRADERLAAELELAFISLKRRNLDEAAGRLADAERAIETAEEEGSTPVAAVRSLKQTLKERRAFEAYLSGDTDAADAFYSEAIDLVDVNHPKADETIARLSTNRGMIRVARKNFEAGGADLKRASEAFVKIYGERHLMTAKATHNIAYAEFERGDYAAAIATMREALGVYEKVLDADHPDLATARKLYGTMLTAAGDPEEAIAPLEGAAAGFAAAYGPHYYDVGYSLVYLAAALAEAGRHDEARRALDRAGVIYAKNFKPGEFDLADLDVYRGIVAGKAGDRAAAGAYCRSGLTVLARILGEKDAYLADMSQKCAAAAG